MMACLVLAARGLVAPGYMVAPADSRGAVAIIPCDGHGGAAAWVKTDHRRKDDGRGGWKSDRPCIFAGFSAIAAPDASPPLAGPARRDPPVAAAVASAVVPGRGIAAPPPPPTGPPSLI